MIDKSEEHTALITYAPLGCKARACEASPLSLYPNSITQVRTLVNRLVVESQISWGGKYPLLKLRCNLKGLPASLVLRGGRSRGFTLLQSPRRRVTLRKISENLYENIGASNNRSTPRTPHVKRLPPPSHPRQAMALGKAWLGQAKHAASKVQVRRVRKLPSTVKKVTMCTHSLLALPEARVYS